MNSTNVESKPYFEGKHLLITGGCGFIGSHLIDKLIQLNVADLVVVDDFSAGTNNKYIQGYENITLIQRDIRDDELYSVLPTEIDILIHLAAQPSVPVSVKKPYFDFDVNVAGTIKLLEYARKWNVEHFIFTASGGTVYGEAEKLPTPEFYPLRPISNYGAAKAAVEMYLKSYNELYGLKTTSMRFGNVYGPRSGHGVMFDFYQKLKKDSTKLHILGDGKQEKSYLYIADCVKGFLYAASRKSSSFMPINMSAGPPISVKKIADLICEIMGLSPEYSYSDGDRGWIGDVRKGQLDTTRLINMGWKPSVTLEDGILQYINWLENK